MESCTSSWWGKLLLLLRLAQTWSLCRWRLSISAVLQAHMGPACCLANLLDQMWGWNIPNWGLHAGNKKNYLTYYWLWWWWSERKERKMNYSLLLHSVSGLKMLPTHLLSDIRMPCMLWGVCTGKGQAHVFGPLCPISAACSPWPQCVA